MNPTDRKAEYPAKIPGSVLSALLDAEAIPNPYYRRNEYRARELFREDYCFRREFQVEEEILSHEEIDLVCMGLDTLAHVELNGFPVLEADNMHREWRIPAKPYLKPGMNRIKIVFSSPLKYIEQYRYGENREISYTPCGAMKGNQLIRKAHSMFGWDWGPQLPDAGIFRDIFLECRTGRTIQEVYVRQLHHGESGEVTLRIKVTLSPGKTRQEGQKLKVLFREKQGGEPVAFLQTILRSRDFWEGELTVCEPKLWWPNGYGAQPLYELLIRLEDPDERLVQEEKKTIGLRTLTVSRGEDQWGREFAFTVNGVKIFAMGANYIPEDCIYSRISKERQAYLLESARQANFNCIRVWGGGYYPSDAFYELCDEKGLIVWQDLMFACNVYEGTKHFLDNCRQEVLDNVRRLRHHPALGLWCGNNEIESAWDHWEDFQKESMYLRADYIKLFEQVIPDAVRQADPDTFFWPSSPSSGGCFADPDAESDGDTHYWDVWHGQKPFTDYRNYYFRFCSEFGFQSFPGLKTISSFTLPKDRNIFSRVMESHQKNGAANGKILYYLSENFRYPSDFGQLLYISQILQGMAIQYGVEHWRRNRGRCMGTLYWQLNDNWPVASWSSIDYFGRWKALHYMAKRFFAPCVSSIVIEKGKARLFVENETRESQGWQAKLWLKSVDGRILGEASGEGRTECLSAEEALEMNLEAFVPAEEEDWEEQVFVESQIKFDCGEQAKNVETLLPYKYLQLKEATVTVKVFEQERESSFTEENCVEQGNCVKQESRVKQENCVEQESRVKQENCVEQESHVKQGNGIKVVLSSDCFVPFVELDVEGEDVLFSDNYFHLTGREEVFLYAEKRSMADDEDQSDRAEDRAKGRINGAEDLLNRLRIRSLEKITVCRIKKSV